MAPQKFISEKALKVWRLTGLFVSLLSWVISAGLIFLVSFFDWPRWIIAGIILLALVFTYMDIYLIPIIRWKRWRYDVQETEIEIQSGLFIIRRTLVPMVRVQHVDTRQGPLLRKYGLASVQISTAATIHEIPALDLSEADELRHYISAMASVVEDDV
ncbi:PH domain-containing protein [Bacillus sp. V5-8f]|uniref:PH domain-containing protein n=1 Tax=Bacillus sp. V5-8f TaxID=2053044 RepID=UPI0021554D47|nr:PH domain-containing protein [Bacillus sp. V5-8f]